MIGLLDSAYRPYSDPEDYIIRCTDDIWRDRGIGRITTEFYGRDVVVHSPYGTVPGVDAVVAGTTMRIASYPRRFAKAEDVVWEERGREAFVSSHRVFSTGVHDGWNQYGPASHRPFTMRALAHCLVDRGRIVHEWLVRDEMALVLALGHDPQEQAVRLARMGAWHPLELGSVPKNPLQTGVSGARPASDAIDEALVELVGPLVNERMFQQTGRYVDDAVVLHTTRGRRVQGLSAYIDTGIELLASFPDARVRVLDVAGHEHPRRGRRVAVVWLLTGTYTGAPEFGPANDAETEILGASQFVVHDGRVVEEFRVYDEMALRIQVESRRAAAGEVA